jgi:hypothetical protein
MTTLREKNGRAYRYFKDAMQLLLLEDINAEKRAKIQRLLVSLETAQVRMKCPCGKKACMTYEFVADDEYKWVVPLPRDLAENRYLLALATPSGDLVCLEAHTQR